MHFATIQSQLEFVGKIIRGQIANNMFMFDPLVFFIGLLMYFWGFKFLFIFLFFNVFLADAVSGGFTDGSFLNFILFHLSPLIADLLFHRFGLFVVGNATAIIYSATYFPIRTKLMGADPFATGVKAVTNVLFVYLYLTFFGPIFELIM